MKKRLAIVITHPIQYYAPVFKLLSLNANLEVCVFYTAGLSKVGSFDDGFGKEISWDVPLLEGYQHKFLSNFSNGRIRNGFFSNINFDIFKEIENWSPNYVLIYGWNYFTNLFLITFASGKYKLLFRGDSTLLDKSGRIKMVTKMLLLRFLYSRIYRFLSVGTLNSEYYKKYGVQDEKIYFVPHSINNQIFALDTPRDIVSKRIRESLGFEPNDVIILFVGKFQSKKQPDFLLVTFLRYLDKNPKTNKRLLLIGDGELKVKITELAGTNPYIKILPFQNQTFLPNYYAASDILCLPSKGPGETWGLVVNEAMTIGIPAIVSTSCGCHKDLVVDNQTGYTFDYDDDDKLEKIIENLDKNHLIEMGNNAKKLIQNYSIEQQVQKILDLIN